MGVLPQRYYRYKLFAPTWRVTGTFRWLGKLAGRFFVSSCDRDRRWNGPAVVQRPRRNRLDGKALVGRTPGSLCGCTIFRWSTGWYGVVPLIIASRSCWASSGYTCTRVCGKGSEKDGRWLSSGKPLQGRPTAFHAWSMEALNNQEEKKEPRSWKRDKRRTTKQLQLQR